jgi:hypothetical protein
MGGTVLLAHLRRTDGVQPSTTNHQPAAADHRPTDAAVLASTEQSHGVGTTNTDSCERTGQCKEVTSRTRNGQGTSTRTGRYDLGHTAIWRCSPRFEDSVSKCIDVSSQSGPSCSPGSGLQRPEISRLPGLFRIRSNSVERLDRSTLDGNMTQARQLSRRTVAAAIHVQSPERKILRPDFPTRPEGWNDRARRPTTFYKTHGSSLWRPRLNSCRRTENARD